LSVAKRPFRAGRSLTVISLSAAAGFRLSR